MATHLTEKVIIAPLPKEAMPQLEELFRRVYRFSAAEAVPGWLMYTASWTGGVVLGAYRGGELIGGSFAAPAFDGSEATLWLMQLAIVPEHRSRGLGERLNRSQRKQALWLGYRRIRACTDVLASHLLALYLARLPGRLVAYRASLYHGLTSGAVHGGAGDEVELEWDLHDTGWESREPSFGARLPELLTETTLDRRGKRCLRSTHAGSHLPRRLAIELPWSVEELKQERPDEALRWRRAVGELLVDTLDRGYEGIDVMSDRGARRSYLILERRRGGGRFGPVSG